jgi:hypothetical protein
LRRARQLQRVLIVVLQLQCGQIRRPRMRQQQPRRRQQPQQLWANAFQSKKIR